MILGGVTLLDCLVFVVFLAPQLLIQVGPIATFLCGLRALPFLVVQLPLQLVRERIFAAYSSRSPFVQRASLFQDLVIRCVRYAFANIPASIGAVFFSKHVALPFMRFRMLRHGYVRCPIHFSTIYGAGMTGVWLIRDPTQPPDVVVYYCHGGGFAMGSTFFYLEFLMAWLSLLKSRQGYVNPAVFGLEYTLVPKASFPQQLHECKAGYDFVLSKLPNSDPARVCLAGDSAGATLILSLLLSHAQDNASGQANRAPAGFVTLISPWCKLLSERTQDTASDYLNAASLRLYAQQYASPKGIEDETLVNGHSSHMSLGQKPLSTTLWASPGDCEDLGLWAAVPAKAYHFIYGSEEVFASETESCIRMIERGKGDVHITNAPGIHAWPIVNLFLGNAVQDRLKGLDRIVDVMGRHMVF